MTLLILGLYLADIVTGFDFAFKFVLIVCGIIAFVYILFFGYTLDIEKTDVVIRIFKACYKKYFTVLIFSLLTFVVLPSKNTIYISTGLITGQKVMEQVQNNPLYEKSIKLLEKKIDEALSEAQEPKRKKDKKDEN